MRVAARLLGPAVLGLVAAGLTQSTVTKRIDPATTGALTGRAVSTMCRRRARRST